MSALGPLFDKARLKVLQERREWLLNELDSLPPHSRKRVGVEHLLHSTTTGIFIIERDLERHVPERRWR
jgi:hypothetical protein